MLCSISGYGPFTWVALVNDIIRLFVAKQTALSGAVGTSSFLAARTVKSLQPSE